MAQVLSAFTEGCRRVARAPAVLAGVFAVTLLVAVPAGHLVQQSIEASLGSSLVADDMVRGVNTEWWDQYLETATGLTRSFRPAVIGGAAVLDNLSRFADQQPHVPAVAALGSLYLLLWLFLVGGVLDRLARNRPVRAAAFFAACGTYFVRFLRLAVIAAAGYYVVFVWLHGWLFGSVYRLATFDLSVERTAFAVRLALYLVFGAAVVLWTLLLDYAKVRAVVEDRRSMLGALMAGSRFALRHPKKTGLLWLVNAACLAAALGLYALVAPGAAGGTGAAWLAFGVGQLYIVARLFLKLAAYGSQISLFQSMMAHAEYTAAPLPAWPESPVVEAITGDR